MHIYFIRHNTEGSNFININIIQCKQNYKYAYFLYSAQLRNRMGQG